MSATIETERINLLGLTRPQLEEYVAGLGSKPFRAPPVDAVDLQAW